MNEKGHVMNAVLLSVGIGFILNPAGDWTVFLTIVEWGIPIVAGALIPDIDTSFGTHRKTFHNVITLGIFVAFPLVFDNLHYVWMGILTHYILDLLGNVRGMAIFYPWPKFYDIPVGVTVDSQWANIVTLAVTALELAGIAIIVHVLDPSPVVDILRQLISG